MYYIIYKTTCIVTNKYYIGVHKQQGLDFDGYYGSGLLLTRSIRKHGKANHQRETLFVFDNQEAAFQKEKEIVTQKLICENDCLNLCVGGAGGDKFFLKTPEEKLAARRKAYQTKIKNNTLYDSTETKKIKSISSKLRITKHPHSLPDNKNRKHNAAALENMRKASATKTGKYIWITNGKEEKLEERNITLENGWYYGRSDDMVKFSSHTEESKKKISNSPNIKGIVCYTNGVRNLKLQKNQTPPDGFYKGMAQKHNSTWITNGVDTKLHPKSIDIPEGWHTGRTFNKNEK